MQESCPRLSSIRDSRFWYNRGVLPRSALFLHSSHVRSLYCALIRTKDRYRCSIAWARCFSRRRPRGLSSGDRDSSRLQREIRAGQSQRLLKVVASSLGGVYSRNYGFIPQTYPRQRSLDVLVLCQEPVQPLALIKAAHRPHDHDRFWC